MLSQGSSNAQDSQVQRIHNINSNQQDIHIHLNYNAGGTARNLVVDASSFYPAAAQH